MPQAEMVMIPSENGRPAEYVTRREANLLYARMARNERKEHEQEELERTLTESGSSAESCDEEREVAKPIVLKQEHGATSAPKPTPQAESKPCPPGSECTLLDPHRKRENVERGAKIMEGRSTYHHPLMASRWVQC